MVPLTTGLMVPLVIPLPLVGILTPMVSLINISHLFIFVFLLYICQYHYSKMNRVMRKPAFCICENKDADQPRGNREADQRLCFRYTDSIELRSGLNLLIQCFFFFFSCYYTVGAHFKKGKHKIFVIFVRASGNVSTYRDHSEVFMSDVLVMQRGSIS